MLKKTVLCSSWSYVCENKVMRLYALMAVVLGSLCGTLSVCAAALPVDLRCDYRTEPVGVSKTNPGLAWRIDSDRPGTMQAAFQIQAASSEKRLLAGHPDLWDSGPVDSKVSIQIPYRGKKLSSRQICFWRVRIKPEGEKEFSEWSAAARWEMALLNASDWQARWIRSAETDVVPETDALRAWMYAATYFSGNANKGTNPQRRPSDWKPGASLPADADRLRNLESATWFRKDFSVSKQIVRARLYSTAAGYADFYLDGQKLGERIRNPGQTDFDQRILYDIDVLDARLAPGPHTLSAHLGQGFYGQNAGFSANKFFYGRPSILAQLEITYADGSTEIIATDGSWETHPSRVVKNNIYAGEVFDGTRSMERRWSAAEVLETAPTQQLHIQSQPTVQAVRQIEPVKLLEPAPGVWVFDFGQNFTGLVEMNCSQLDMPAGSPVWLRYAEWSDQDGNIGMNSGGGFATRVNQVDAYIAGGSDPEPWRPSFTWHGFRYVEVTGLKQKPNRNLLTGYLLRSAVPTAGTFRSSSEHLNRVHRTALWTYESNLISIPSDCPIRERCGWTGDAHAALTLSNYNFDMALFWEKNLADFRTNKKVSPAIVPGKRGGGNNPDWPVAQVLVAGEHYLFHADTQVIRDHYAQLLKFMDYYKRLQKQGIISKGYGDWCDPVRNPGDERRGGAGKPQQTPPEITSTALFIEACSVMEELSALMGKDGEVQKFAKWKQETAAAFHREFYDKAAGSYGSQTADAMALCFDIVPDKMRAKVAESLNHDVLKNWKGHASVGALGHRWLYPALADHGYADTALGTFFAKGHPGFYYLFDVLNGTSLWERKGAFNPQTMKEPARSLSHPFQGGYDAWFYLGLGGIRPDWKAPGFKRIMLQPEFPKELDWVEVDYPSGYGTVSSHWKRAGAKLEWTVVLPPNTSGKVVLPRHTFTAIEIDGRPIPLSTLFSGNAGNSSYPLPSGNHVIHLTQ